MINVTDFTKELFRKWYPFDVDPTADEWAAVPQHFAPVQAIQHVKRARMVRLKDDTKSTRHPTLEEVAAVSVYKDSIDHQRQIAEYKNTNAYNDQITRDLEFLDKYGSGKKTINEVANNATNKRRTNAAQSNGSASRHIQRARNGKAKRNKRK